MRIGLMLPSYVDREERMAVLREADEAGVEIAFIGESAGTNVFVETTEAVLSTDDIRIGPGIANVFSRTPSLIALSAAELDHVSDGRIVLGLGTSTKPLVEGVHGMPFERPVPRLAEYVEIIRRGWTGDRFDYDGEFYSPSGGRLLTRPVQEALPIGVAALGPRNRALTGEVADFWIPHLVPRSALAESAETVYGSAREAGRSPDEVEVYAYVPTAVDDDPGAARDMLRRHVASYAGAAAAYRDAVARGGYESEAGRIHEAWQAGDRDRAADLVSDALVDDVGIAGTPDSARDALGAWEEAGADVAVLHFPPGSDGDSVRTALDALA